MAKKKNSKKKNPKVNKIKDQMIQEQEIMETEAVETINEADAIEAAPAEVIETAEVTKDTVIIDTSDITASQEPEVTEVPKASTVSVTEVPEAAEAPKASEPETPDTPVVTEASKIESLEVPEAPNASEHDSAEITKYTAVFDTSDITASQKSDIPDVIELSGPIADEAADSPKPADITEVISTVSHEEPVNEVPAFEPKVPIQKQEPVMHENTEVTVHNAGKKPADTEFETIPRAAESQVETTALPTVTPEATGNTSPEVVKKPKESKFKALFGDKPVTRKFLAIALASALLLNALITAGLMGIFAGGLKKDIEKSINDLNPPQLFDHDFGNQGGGMTPPDWNNDNDRDYDDRYDNDWDDDDRYDHDWDDDNQYGNDWGNNDDDNYSGAYPWSGQQESNDSQQSQQGQQNASGVTIGIVISENNGVYITEVTGNNAQKAGFKAGDRIVSFDGKNINDSNSLISEVQNHKAGDKVKVIVERDGKETTITTTLE